MGVGYEPGVHSSPLRMQPGVAGIGTTRGDYLVKRACEDRSEGGEMLECVPVLRRLPTFCGSLGVRRMSGRTGFYVELKVHFTFHTLRYGCGVKEFITYRG